MIAYIKGRVAYTDDTASYAVLESGGIGYRIFVPAGDLELLPGEGGEAKLYTYLQVREDAFVLYGFLTREDRRLFEQLVGVSGIGPKAALGILGSLSPDDFRFAVLSDDAKTIAKAPGVGVKTAKKIILELKDKLDLEDALESAAGSDEASGRKEAVGHRGGMDGAHTEAVEALTALGYSSAEALKAVKQVDAEEGAQAGDILKAALKVIG